MKKAVKYILLAVGVLFILLGILIPTITFNQKQYYEYNTNISSGSIKNYNFIVTSKTKLEISSIEIGIDYEDAPSQTYDLTVWQEQMYGDKYQYSFSLQLNFKDFVDEVEFVKIRTTNETINVKEKLNQAFKIPCILFPCLIGFALMITGFVNIVSSKTNNKFQNMLETIKETSEVLKPKAITCAYCGSNIEEGETKCAACGAQVKKKK